MFTIEAVHTKYASPSIGGEWDETLYAQSPDPSAFFFLRAKSVACETSIIGPAL